MDITKAEAVWLVEEFAPMRQLRVDQSTISNYVKAINIILDQNREVPKCASCEWRTMAMIANNVYEQFETQIMEVYNSTKTTKGRKKK